MGLSWITLGQMQFFRFRGYRQVAHKWKFMRHMSVSPVPHTRKTLQSPKSDLTPLDTNFMKDSNSVVSRAVNIYSEKTAYIFF